MIAPLLVVPVFGVVCFIIAFGFIVLLRLLWFTILGLCFIEIIIRVMNNIYKAPFTKVTNRCTKYLQ